MTAHHRRNQDDVKAQLASQRTKVELVRETYEQALERAGDLALAGMRRESRFVAAQAREFLK
jgi:hypothetical protein